MSLIVITREQFLERYENENTRKQAILSLKKWDLFLAELKVSEADIFNELRLPENKNKRYVFVQQFVNFLNRTMRSVKNYFNFVKSWIKYNDVELDNERVKTNVKFPKPIRYRPKGIDREVVKNVYNKCNPFYRTLLEFQTSSGMRIKRETLNMKWSWINFDTNPVHVVIPGEYSKTGQERITFITPEAANDLKIMRIGKNPEDRVFPRCYGAVREYFAKIRDELGLNERAPTGIHHFRPHKFRGYAENRISKAVGSEYAHALLGHTEGLIEYFQGGTTDKEAGEDYLKAVSSLTINDDSMLKDENAKLKEKVESIDEMKRKLMEYEDRIKILEKVNPK